MRKSWTVGEIKRGFERFLNTHGRLPKALEIDEIAYLPTSRFIQYRFGGLEKLRHALGYGDTHFGKGRFRSVIASRVNIRGRAEELTLQNILHERFGEMFVHSEKIFDKSKNRVDFFVYSPDGDFGVDVFYTESMHFLQSIINIKRKKYQNFTADLFLAVANKSFSQSVLDKYAASKVKPLPHRAKLVTLGTFLAYIQRKLAYDIPGVRQG
ncbi:hypothetical protein HY969_02545 [Candidatus Kaiserbacteria bacterium]|nr:hypothetical protein [Candidatus Kaiserbacteria bacterium]